MKKFYCFIIMLFFGMFVFVGCGSNNIIVDASENANLYKITANLDYENKMLSATENLEYTNRSELTLTELKFHLHPNAFSESADSTKAVSATQMEKAYNNGFSEGNIKIVSTYVNNTESAFEITGEENSILQVKIPELNKNQTVDIKINFVLTIPNVNHRFGYGDNTLNLGNWYPIVCVLESEGFFTQPYNSSGDPFYSEISNYLVDITYDENLKIAHTGELKKSTTSNGKNKVEISALAVRDFALVFSEKFEVATAQVGDTLVQYFYYNDDNYEFNLQTAVDSLNTFSELIGEYPYSVLNIVKCNFLHGGMEYPMLVYISDVIEVQQEYTNVIIHEIAHQWWYGVVGNNQLAYGWLDEGLAEYSTAIFYKINPQYDVTYDDVVGNALSAYLLFCDVYREVYETLDTSMNRNVLNFNTDTEYVYLSYVKGLLMFDAVSELIGDKKMEKCLQQYYDEFSMKFATPNGLIKSFEKSSGKDLQSYITSWLDGTVVLEQLAG